MRGWTRVWYITAEQQLFSISQPSASFSDRPRRQEEIKEMAGMTKFFVCFALLMAVLFALLETTEANYKNAPMNGIMFGKRGPSEYEARSKTFTALCEIATEACLAWFPSQDNK